MASRKTTQPLKAGPFLWGPRRVNLQVTLRDLEDATGINRGSLSAMERGRLFPTAAEFKKVTDALDAREAEIA